MIDILDQIRERLHPGACFEERDDDLLNRAMIEIERLRTALKPFSDIGGELFARNWNAGDVGK